MREPIPIDPLPRPMRVPDEHFMEELTFAIKGGATPAVAARWLGISGAMWRTWRLRQGEPWDTLRERVRAAVAHLEVKLMNDLARKNPNAALARLRPKPQPTGSPDYQRFVAREAQKKPYEKLGLTYAEELFCKELMTDPEENATAAVERVGMWDAKTHGSIKNIGSRLLKKPRIIARLGQLKADALMRHERKTRTKVTAERVLQKYVSIAFADPRRVVTVDEHGATVFPSDTWYDEDAEAVKSISNTSEGVKIEFHAAQPALDKLAEITGLTKVAIPGMVGVVQIERAIVMIPDNHRDPLLLPPVDDSQQPVENNQQPTNGAVIRPTAILDFPLRDDKPTNGDGHGHDPQPGS